MAQPFTGYTDQEADAIRQTLIEEHLKREADWPHFLNAITNTMYQAYKEVSNPGNIVYAGEAARRLKTLIAALDTTVEAHEQLGDAVEAHLDDQLHSVELVRGGYCQEWKTAVRCLLSSDQFQGALKAVREAAVLAAKKPNPYGASQTTGAPLNLVMRQAIGELLGIFEMATGVEPKVYTSQHHNDGYGGNFYKFAVACLVPVHLVPTQQLGSAILAGYKNWQMQNAWVPSSIRKK